MTKPLRLTELLGDDRPVISEQTFTNRLIVGPAVIFPFDSRFEGCEWSADFDATFWPLAADRARAVGAVFVERCTFIDCVFNGVGLAAPEGEAGRYRALWP